MTTFVASADEAVAGIHSGQHIWVHSMAASPVLLLQALARRARDLRDLTVMQMHLEHAEALADPALYGRLRNRVFFAGASTRDLINTGQADYVPVFLSEIPRLLRHGHQPVDVALVQVSPPDRHGFCSLGVSVEVTRAACDAARTIVAHINPRMPRTQGDSSLALADIDVAFEQAADVIEHAPEPATPDIEAIGRRVAELVRDGDCLQLGIGEVPDAVLACLGNHRHLGIHTEMFSDGLLPLLESGVVDNSRKNIHCGKVVATFVMGSRKVYDFVDDNPSIRMLDVEYVNNIATIRKNRQMVSINGAIQVDLTGQVCADSIGSRIYSGVGGQLDFVLGAQLADEGRSIIALPSTAVGGTVSRIVPHLSQGAGVVTTRAHVDYIATEYGVARLKGRSLAERARALTAIAHPAFRDALQAHTAGLGA